MRRSDSPGAGGARSRAAIERDVAHQQHESFGERLRQHRERRQISIASIAESTKILAALLDGLEHDDVSRWPSGLYRRSFMRAYAVAIGLEPEPIVRQFLERFPDPEDRPAAPVPALVPVPVGKAPRAVLRLTLADPGSEFSAGRVVRELGRRLSAVAMDAFVLGVAGLGLFLILGAFWAPLSVAGACYYFGSILVLGNTPGVCLFASSDRGDGRPGSAGGRRSWRGAWKALRSAVRAST